ncbi:hypothetical protein AgCh_027003 [Apium graveolens]
MALIVCSTNISTCNNNTINKINNSFYTHKPLKFFNPKPRISVYHKRQPFCPIVAKLDQEEVQTDAQDNEEANSLGVRTALSMLKFYKREISPLMPNSCRYLPTCSEYSMIAYKKYGVAKGTILTAWRLCRCNPLGGSGFDPPRWFGETRPPEE